MVIEALAELLAARITKQIDIPTIGIGASSECDGQILVLEDMLGLSPRVPKFVKEYAQLGAGIEAAVKAFAAEVRTRAFPAPDNTYPMFEDDARSHEKDQNDRQLGHIRSLVNRLRGRDPGLFTLRPTGAFTIRRTERNSIRLRKDRPPFSS